MAETVKSESFTSAMINTNDMTITEFAEDSTNVYSLLELLKRWNGVADITLTIRRSVPLPPDGRDGY